MMPRLINDQNDSIELVCVVPTTYSPFAVPDYAMIVVASEQAIAAVFVGREQLDAGSIRNLTNETIERGRIGVLDHLADHVTFATDRADDWNLSLSTRQIERP